MPVIKKFRAIDSTGKVKKGYKERYVSIAETMILHENFISLSSSAKTLYLYMKYWACGKEEITYASSLAEKYMTKPTFRKARDELVNKGFLKYVECGKFSRTPNIYKFISDWHYKTKQ